MDLQTKHHIEQARGLSNIDTTYSEPNLNFHKSNEKTVALSLDQAP